MTGPTDPRRAPRRRRRTGRLTHVTALSDLSGARGVGKGMLAVRGGGPEAKSGDPEGFDPGESGLSVQHDDDAAGKDDDARRAECVPSDRGGVAGGDDGRDRRRNGPPATRGNEAM